MSEEKIIMSPTHRFYVVAEFDHEAGVWYVVKSDVPGLNAEAENPTELVEILEDLIPQLLVANGVLSDAQCLPDVPYSLMLDSLRAGQAHC